MSIKENKALVRRVVEFANRRDLPAFWQPFAPESVVHDATGDKSLEQFKQHTSMVFAAFPDFHWTIEDVIAEGDKVVFEVHSEEPTKASLLVSPQPGRR